MSSSPHRLPRVLAFDVDGTLLATEIRAAEDAEEPPARTCKAIEAARRLGIHLCIATGRPAPATTKLVQSWSIGKHFEFVVGGNGNQTIRVADGEVVDKAGKSAKTTALVIDFVEQLRAVCPDLAIVMEVEDANGQTLYIRDIEHEADNFDWTRWRHMPYFKDITFKFNILDVLRTDGIDATGPLYAYAPKGDTLYRIWDRFVAGEYGARALEQKSVTLGVDADAERGPIHIQLMELDREKPGAESMMGINIQGCDKATALERLCSNELAQAAGPISKDDVMVFGNDYNDLGMFSWAGTAVVMADSPAPALAAADIVVPSAREEGVAQAIERLLAG
eukprot:g1028.t1